MLASSIAVTLSSPLRLIKNGLNKNDTCKLCKRFLTTGGEGVTPVLEQVGVFMPPLGEGTYMIGQTFLHRVFAYRGVILYPWKASIYERNTDVSSTSLLDSKSTDLETTTKKPGSASKTETYYQVLMDMRDSPHVAAHSEAVTFLHTATKNRTQSLYTIPGIDYVSHDDIIPYASTEDAPIRHDLFDKFLHHDSDARRMVPSEMLQGWQESNRHCLELSKVHKETTGNVRVTAIPFYLGLKDSQSSHPTEYWWRYCIRVENIGETPVRLRERHWRIISNGSVKTVRGRGITGKEPLLDAETPVFQYSSHISLQSSSGHVWGTFRLEAENGEQFDARIPAFALENKKSKHDDLNDPELIL